ncbi:exosortase family protein XrtF [Winogradskyella echinorum]|uniref:Exosortase family protein XrtF n=1 Tax=Winogradskyella echinorum TaxID=538189 RepID=A0ABR6XX37_9FLAO|nr:exosortase family protein XrtF [Winogradskyella echinorum]MBC3845062.1 exosortase family protein XrtF [Winogradskyella echinorum]MBC5749410.1 exosortase family protein XrtF [Winogradskyella echinorum]
MKSLFEKYKLVIKFIVTFLAVYTVLSIGYNIYLSLSDGSKFYPDYVTNLVAKQTNTLLNSVGYEASVVQHPNEPSMKININGKFVARVIQGCNAVSIIILFLSFIIAFSGKFKTTLFYCFAGSIIIYAFNLIRIVILSIGLYHYPWRRELLHNIIFPMLIYGTVFLLWMVWVNRFSKSVKSNA